MVGIRIQALRSRDFDTMHKVWGRASTGSKASGLGDKAPWSCRIFIKQIQNLSISENKRNSLWSFSSTSELRIISRRHVDRRQVLLTVDRRPSLVDHTQRQALCTAQWWLGVTQRVARSVGVSEDLLRKPELTHFPSKIHMSYFPRPSTGYDHVNLSVSQFQLIILRTSQRDG